MTLFACVASTVVGVEQIINSSVFQKARYINLYRVDHYIRY